MVERAPGRSGGRNRRRVMSPIKLKSVGFRAGLAWLPAGAELFVSALGPMVSVASLWLLVSLLASLVPILGQLALMLITPLLTAGLLAAFDLVRRGRQPRPGTLFAGWSDPTRRIRLLGLGAISLAGTMVAATALAGILTSQLEPGVLEQAMNDPEALARAMQQVSLGWNLILPLGLFLLVVAALLFAVPMVMLANAPVGSALRYSLSACFSNLPALAGLLLATLAMGVALGLVLGLLVSLLGLALGQAGALLAQILMMIATVFVQVVLTGAQYCAFCQISDWGRSGGGGPPIDGQDDSPDDDQLLA